MKWRCFDKRRLVLFKNQILLRLYGIINCRVQEGNLDDAEEHLVENEVDVLLLDLNLQGHDGFELLKNQVAKAFHTVVISAYGEKALEAFDYGVLDFIEKPFEAERLLLLVERATETERLRRENTQLRESNWANPDFTGNSPAINAVRATLKRVANTGSRVMITGPAGAGKEVAARMLHVWSSRAEAAFVLVNSARITPERFEQELFGEEADGRQIKPGLLELADGGTLYLDEVADMPLSTQARILRVLTEQSFVRVGGTRQIGVDVRVVSSTSRDLAVEMEEKRFREDLFYRLNVVPVTIPSLADRRDDIPALADHFFTRYSSDQGIAAPDISEEAMAALQAYDWPGNVRQLRNVVERTIIMTPRERLTTVETDMLPGEITGGRLMNSGDGLTAMMGVPLREARESFEREYLTIQIRRFSGNISKTATFIGMERSALHRKLKLLGMADRREVERK